MHLTVHQEIEEADMSALPLPSVPGDTQQPTDQSNETQLVSLSGQPMAEPQQPPAEEDIDMQQCQPGMQSPVSTPPPGNTQQPTNQSSSQSQGQWTPISGLAAQQPHIEEDVDMPPSQPSRQSSAATPLSGNTQQPTNQMFSRSQGASASQGSSQLCHTCPRTMHGLHSASNLIAKTFEESFSRTAEAVIAKAIESHINPILRSAATRSSGKERKESAAPPQTSNDGATDVEMTPGGADGEDFDDEPDDVYRQKRRQRKSRGEANRLHVGIPDDFIFI
jgi:hypothetical protein